jgi:hypothetical protein
MRPLLILLLAANLLMFAWVQGWLDRVSGAPALPEQVHPERLRVVPIDRLGDPPSPVPPPAPSPVPSPRLAPAKARSMEPFAPPSSTPIPTPSGEPLPAPRRSPPREAMPMPYAAGPAAALLKS